MIHVVRRLPETWSSILVFLFPKSKQNFKIKWVGWRVFFAKKIIRGGKATQTEPSKKELHRSHFEELTFLTN